MIDPQPTVLEGHGIRLEPKAKPLLDGLAELERCVLVDLLCSVVVARRMRRLSNVLSQVVLPGSA